MDSRVVKLDDLELVVYFHYQKGLRGDYYQPDDPDTFEIMDIEHCYESIMSIVGKDSIRQLEEIILDKII